MKNVMSERLKCSLPEVEAIRNPFLLNVKLKTNRTMEEDAYLHYMVVMLFMNVHNTILAI
jgi:hypothetical protein